MDKDSTIDDFLNQFKTNKLVDAMTYLQIKYPHFEGGLQPKDIVLLLDSIEKMGLIKKNRLQYELDTFGNDIVFNQGGWIKYLDKVKSDNIASDKKNKLELLKIRTDIVKNSIWIAGFIISFIFNLLYLFGIVTFHFFQPDKNIQEVKYQIEQKQLKDKSPVIKKNTIQSNTIRVDSLKQER
jgi:hypothetical protein